MRAARGKVLVRLVVHNVDWTMAEMSGASFHIFWRALETLCVIEASWAEEELQPSEESERVRILYKFLRTRQMKNVHIPILKIIGKPFDVRQHLRIFEPMKDLRIEFEENSRRMVYLCGTGFCRRDVYLRQRTTGRPRYLLQRIRIRYGRITGVVYSGAISFVYQLSVWCERGG
ncbi:hypothetical protein CPC08DRAFT_260754 [Agrocybe pediades]|nr:hypothetical protein CPC08DRAFT_260754 [Agrocybe pediades]